MDALAAKAKQDNADKDILLIDGIRVQDDDGWWLIRASNTESSLIVRAEGRDEATLAEKITQLTQLLASQDIIWDYQPA